jgi:uridine kinase
MNITNKSVKLILVGGGTCSGKTSVSEILYKKLTKRGHKVIIISNDLFYKTLDKSVDPLTYNFDHPDAFDQDLIVSTLKQLKNRCMVQLPCYDYVEHQRQDKCEDIHPTDIIIFEGIFALYFQEIREMADYMTFVDTDADIRLCRRIKRDLNERGRELEGILKQYELTVHPSHKAFVKPTKQYAHVVVPRGKDNKIAISTIIAYVTHKLDKL